jgi:hypothetical protein
MRSILSIIAAILSIIAAILSIIAAISVLGVFYSRRAAIDDDQINVSSSTISVKSGIKCLLHLLFLLLTALPLAEDMPDVEITTPTTPVSPNATSVNARHAFISDIGGNQHINITNINTDPGPGNYQLGSLFVPLILIKFRSSTSYLELVVSSGFQAKPEWESPNPGT